MEDSNPSSKALKKRGEIRPTSIILPQKDRKMNNYIIMIDEDKFLKNFKIKKNSMISINLKCQVLQSFSYKNDRN